MDRENIFEDLLVVCQYQDKDGKPVSRRYIGTIYSFPESQTTKSLAIVNIIGEEQKNHSQGLTNTKQIGFYLQEITEFDDSNLDMIDYIRLKK